MPFCFDGERCRLCPVTVEVDADSGLCRRCTEWRAALMRMQRFRGRRLDVLVSSLRDVSDIGWDEDGKRWFDMNGKPK